MEKYNGDNGEIDLHPIKPLPDKAKANYCIFLLIYTR